MSAPDYPEEIRNLVADIGFEIGGDDRVWELVDLVERAHAHELAAKIRSEMPHESYAYVGGWEDAADLIDPDKEQR